MTGFIVIAFSLAIIFAIITISIYPKIHFLYPQEEEHYSFIGTWDSEGAEDGQLKRPHSIDVDTFGNVYVADSGNNRYKSLPQRESS